MSIGIQDLSTELVVCLTRVLARRPEYGIARPSRRWLQRQEEKIQHLPKELLRSSNMFKRLAIKIFDSIDPHIMDPQAVLCLTHSRLNPFLIRRLFMALAYEVTVHTDALRSWPGRTYAPELSAFVGRLDSITALWTQPALFQEIYGVAPFDGHHVFVTSGCEACCLAAVGASGRALADLRAALIDRNERRTGKPSGKEPRLYRIVETWIDHLRKHGEEIGRAEECRDLSETLLLDLRIARPQITAWRVERKQAHAGQQGSRRSVYTELRRSSSGAKIAPLPNHARHKRRTRNGIPLAVVDIEGTEHGRAAVSNRRCESIYRPDSLTGCSEVYRRQEFAHELPIDGRPDVPEPDRVSGTSDGSPTHSFLHRFEQEVPLNNDESDNGDEDDDAQEEDERDYYEEERSRVKVQEWYSSRLAESHTSQVQDDSKSVISMVHPAFRPSGSHIAASAIPAPLQFKKDREQGKDSPRNHQSLVSEWTNCTMYTTDARSMPTTGETPPVPTIPSKYGTRHETSKTPLEASQAPQNAITRVPSNNDLFVMGPKSIVPTSSSFKKHETLRTNWPAPPEVPFTIRSNPGPKRCFVSDSDLGSKLSHHRQEFLKERFKVKEPLDASMVHSIPSRIVQMDSSQSSGSSTIPSLSSYGSTTEDSNPEKTPADSHSTGSEMVPQPVSIEDGSDGEEGVEVIKPDDSVSNVCWNRTSVSSVTQLDVFKDKM